MYSSLIEAVQIPNTLLSFIRILQQYQFHFTFMAAFICAALVATGLTMVAASGLAAAPILGALGFSAGGIIAGMDSSQSNKLNKLRL
jgi:hypothetical protein